MSWATCIKTNIVAGSSLEFPSWLHSFQSRLVSIAWHKLSTFTLFYFRGYISRYHHIHEVTTAQFLEHFESNAWFLFNTLITMAHLLFCLVSSSHPPPGWFRVRVCISPDSPRTQTSGWKDQRNRWRRTTWGRYSTILLHGLLDLDYCRLHSPSAIIAEGEWSRKYMYSVQCTFFILVHGIQLYVRFRIYTCHVVSTKCHMITLKGWELHLPPLLRLLVVVR